MSAVSFGYACLDLTAIDLALVGFDQRTNAVSGP
jgi:hypothetical protein